MFRSLSKKLRNWHPDSRQNSFRSASSLSPENPFFAVGDIHGCKDVLTNLIRRVDEVADGSESIVFLGDYIDRGNQSRQVLTWLFEVNQRLPNRVFCLMGNHERMMLDFIDDPAGPGSHWLQNGGLDTLASFGVGLHQRELDTTMSIKIADRLEAALPPGMQDWLRALPLHWSSGNVHCVHAGMSPARAIRDQREEVLLWGHPDFFTMPRSDGNFVVHGHTIVKQATLAGQRIALDTGVYRTGRLSGVRIAKGECRFFEST